MWTARSTYLVDVGQSWMVMRMMNKVERMEDEYRMDDIRNMVEPREKEKKGWKRKINRCASRTEDKKLNNKNNK